MCADIVASNCSDGYIFPNICTEACMLSSFFDNFDYRLSYSRSEKQIYLLFLSLNRNFDYRLSTKTGILTN